MCIFGQHRDRMSGLDVFFVSDIRRGLVSAAVLTIETAAAHGPVNVDFVSGVLAMAKARALSVGIPWSFVVNDARLALGQGYHELLDAAGAGLIEGRV